MFQDWSETGGVLMIGYELYRLLSLKKNKKPRNRKKKGDPPTPIKMFDSKDKIPDMSDEHNLDKHDISKPLVPLNDFKLSDSNPASIPMTDSVKFIDDSDKFDKTKDDFLIDKKEEDDDNDEEKKLLDGN